MRAFFFGLVLIGIASAPAVACGPAGAPPIAAQIDTLLPKAQLPAVKIDKVRVLRAEIAERVAADQPVPARKIEEQAMSILGYRKALLRCGPGSFMWAKL